ncbi:hypothetical protein AEB_P1617 [Altererythrobacter sp. B11]|uniref:hypothetical protein n=1 Tax=Altererythrobacter sp. B11 TaxID=2060312 RepID=UPI000DC71285|nr:hypothetical protein [Altererythrobacter sp. B11]BBC72485.1 hypothetical protein AEB_P1617 [Altererythrobacter sp. B11]
MNLENTGAARRHTLSLRFSGGPQQSARDGGHVPAILSSTLSQFELRRIVAAMVD